MDTDSLYLALAEENLYDCIKPDKRAAWEKRGKMTAETLSRRMQNLISSLERVAVSIKSMINGSRDYLKKNLDVQKYYVCVARYIAAMTTSPMSSNLTVKDKTSELSKILQMDPCQSKGECSMKPPT